MHSLVEKIERKNMKSTVPKFAVGDQVKVHTKIVEGDKTRIQVYQGSVVARNGSGSSATFTVSRISFGYANEKTFQLHSPNLTDIEVLSKGIVRRAKLNYLRGKLGKAAKVRMQVGKQVTREVEVLFEEEPKLEAAKDVPEATAPSDKPAE